MYWKQIKIKFAAYKQQHCSNCNVNVDCGCLRTWRPTTHHPPDTLTNPLTVQTNTGRSGSAPVQSTNRRSSNSSSSSSDSDTEQSALRRQQQQQPQQQQQQPSNPQFSAGAPPSYNIADTFAKVDELGEKPPPYMDPSVPTQPSAPVAPYVPSGPPVEAVYPPPTLDSAYPPPAVYPPSDAVYPPPTYP